MYVYVIMSSSRFDPRFVVPRAVYNWLDDKVVDLLDDNFFFYLLATN